MKHKKRKLRFLDTRSIEHIELIYKMLPEER